MYMTMDAFARSTSEAPETRLGLFQGQTTPFLIHVLPTWTGAKGFQGFQGCEGCEEDDSEEGLVG